MRRWGAVAGLVVAAALALMPATAHAAPADPDPSFGTDGVARIVFGNVGLQSTARVALQPDGRVVVLLGWPGDGWKPRILRFHADGRRDTTFGGNGYVRVPVIASRANARDWHVDAAGRIVVVVSERNPWTIRVHRFRADGSRDTSFSGDGAHTISYGSGVEPCQAPRVDSKGRIVLAGFVHGGGDQRLVVRLRADGKPDTSFAGNGFLVLPEHSGCGPVSVDPRNDGVLVVTNSGLATWGNGSYRITRLTAAGEADPSFGEDGSRVDTFGTLGATVNDAVVDGSGRVIVVGAYGMGDPASCTCLNPINPFVARYLANGDRDAGFATGGRGGYPSPGAASSWDAALRVQLLPGGRIFAFGASDVAEAFGSFSLRLTPDGSRDHSFTQGGIISASTGSTNGDVAWQPDGRFVLATWVDSYNTEFQLRRFRGDSADLLVSELSVTGRAGVRAGDTVSYTVKVRNRGVRTSPATHLRLRVPARARIVSIRTERGTCTAPAPWNGATWRSVRCGFGTLGRRGSRTVVVTIRVPRGEQQVLAQARVRGGRKDARPRNNTRSVVREVRR